MYKWIFLFCLWVLPTSAQNLDQAIQSLTQETKGQIVTPATTAELAALFREATTTKVPRIFVDKFPADFATKGTGGLYMHVITALILRANEKIIKEKMLLTALKNKFDQKQPWSKTEESFFHSLVEKYDVTTFKTTETQLEQLAIKIDEIVPGLAVAQGVYATDWGRKNMEHPYGQVGWLDDKTYAELPYNSLIEATDAYALEMNSAQNYWMWRLRRQRATHRGTKNQLAYVLAGSIRVYRPDDPYYSATIQKIILNNKPLAELYGATFIESEKE